MAKHVFTNRLTTRHLRTVIAVDQAHSIVGAADNLNLTQPSVTKALKEAETVVGVKLFDRTSHGMFATPYGQVLVRHAKIIVAQLTEAVAELADLEAGIGGRVVVGTLLAGSARILPIAIARLNRERPNLAVLIVDGVDGALLPALQAGNIDLVIGRLSDREGGGDGLAREILFKDSACVVVRADHPLCKRHALDVAHLRSFPWILPRKETTLRHQVDNDLHQVGLGALPLAIESVSPLTNRRLLLDFDYISVWPRQAVQEDHDKGRLAILPIDLPSTVGAVGITTRAAGRPSPSAQAVIQAIRDAATSTPP
jgi:DNA-binding transcriptional LysR family regulator